MPADAGIYANFLRPIKSMAEYDQEAAQQKQNALALQQQGMQVDALLRQAADDASYRNALRGFGADTDANYRSLIQAGLGQQAAAYKKADLDSRKTNVDILEGTAKARDLNSQSATRDFKLAQDKTLKHLQQLVGVNDVQSAHQWLDEAAAAGELPAEKVAAVKQQLATNPQMLNQWKGNAMAGGLSLMDQREVQFKQAAQDESVRHNKASEGIQIRGQDLVNDRAKEAAQATMSKPFEVTGPDGKPILVQQDKQGNIRQVEGYGPKTPAPNAAQQKELMSINQQRSILNGALESVDKTPSAFSFKRGLGGKLPFGESVAGRMETPEETQARAYVYNNVSRVINERAGAAQSAQELARLNSFLPADTDGPEQIKNKIRGFNQYLDDLEAGTMGKPKAPPPGGPKPGDVDGGYRFKGGDPSVQSNWEKVK